MPFVMEDGGRTGDQGLALLRQLAERAVASGRVTAPPLWGPFTPAALVAHTVRRWQQRLSAPASFLSLYPFARPDQAN